ncbi:polyketide synthase [Nocardia jejuensis]|uniref:beta-ketoacyl [acyl carrier protein] synthase domain-containing protein n=1 Tax=Nocardia jejuensis TaxID=328049 RepID=UPI00082E9999|nr:polyketide synthase [Nocardia jejuensis]
MNELDPIVISGFALEAPGNVTSASEFWTALRDRRDLMEPFPRDRGWGLELLDPVPVELDLERVPDAGGFLADATRFDPDFFGISVDEAAAMDPQHWAALRVAWQALENAGVDPGRLVGENVGCYIGISFTGHAPRSARIDRLVGYRAAGMALGGASGRISQCLGIVGPSLSIDTACVSSLNALQTAVGAVRSGECEWALAGAVCVMNSPMAYYSFSRLRALSEDGHCKSYSSEATGTVLGEAAGVLVVEHESRARQMGRRVYARILGIGSTHNGKSRLISAPSAQAQARLMRKTLQVAGVSADQVGLIEGHGTAKCADDRAELLALNEVYGLANGGRHRTAVGSVKSNIGHSQAAGGVMGMIKVLLCGVHGQIAPGLCTENPSYDIDWETTSLALAQGLESWPVCDDGMRYAAVSSFSVTGSNAHVLLGLPEQR